MYRTKSYLSESNSREQLLRRIARDRQTQRALPYFLIRSSSSESGCENPTLPCSAMACHVTFRGFDDQSIRTKPYLVFYLSSPVVKAHSRPS